MYATQIKTSRELRNNFAEIQRLLENHDQVVITKNGKGAAVVINFEDYAEFEAYTHRCYVLKALEEAEEEANSPNAEWITLAAFKEKLHEER